MSAVDFQPILNTLYQYHEEYYDAEAPSDLICPITTDLVHQPAVVDCPEGHVFEKQHIQTWMTQPHPTCPCADGPIVKTIRNRSCEERLREWTEHHWVQPIEPKQLAQYLLFEGPASDRPNCVRTGAYLRFIRIANLAHDVATNMIDVIRSLTEREAKAQVSQALSLLQARVTQRVFYGEDSILDHILREVKAFNRELAPCSNELMRDFLIQSRECMETLGGQMQALNLQMQDSQSRLIETLDRRMQDSQDHFDRRMEASQDHMLQTFDTQMERHTKASEERVMQVLNERMLEALKKIEAAEIHSREELEFLKNTLQELLGRMEQEEGAVSELKGEMERQMELLQEQFQRESAEVRAAIGIQEANYGPLSLNEKLQLVISVVGPIALCAFAKACAAHMDNDPDTSFPNEFFNFDFTGIAAGAWRLLHICYYGWMGGNPALHRMSQITPDQLVFAIITASQSYYQSLMNANAHLAANGQIEVISKLNETNISQNEAIRSLHAVNIAQDIRLDKLEAAMNKGWYEKLQSCAIL